LLRINRLFSTSASKGENNVDKTETPTKVEKTDTEADTADKEGAEADRDGHKETKQREQEGNKLKTEVGDEGANRGATSKSEGSSKTPEKTESLAVFVTPRMHSSYSLTLQR
jgi:L,D-peptidoglycan transpeptidase YkuD (ErfK/YbiS/YcfS/YnhG family)